VAGVPERVPDEILVDRACIDQIKNRQHRGAEVESPVTVRLSYNTILQFLDAPSAGSESCGRSDC
jgi:hypothetical protein